jgi:hypothetical protein
VISFYRDLPQMGSSDAFRQVLYDERMSETHTHIDKRN